MLSRMFEKKTEFPGLTNVMLVDDEGSLLGAAKSPDSMGSKNDHLSYCSAVLASVYNEYKVRRDSSFFPYLFLANENRSIPSKSITAVLRGACQQCHDVPPFYEEEDRAQLYSVHGSRL